MMKRTKWIPALVAALMAATLLFSGCKKEEKLAAKVGDHEITVSTLQNMYLSNSSYAYYYGADLSTAEGIESFQDMLLDSLISTEAKVYQAEKAGISLTSEEEEQAKKAAADDYDSFFQQYVDAATKNGATDPEITATKYLTDTLAENGTTVKEVKANFLTSEREELLIKKHEELLLADVAPTEDEIKEKYAAELESQETAFAAEPGAYFTYETYYTYGYTCFPLTIPEGLFYVRQILVSDEALAKDIAERAKAGEDFEALLKEYNTDPGMDSKPEGYLVGQGANFVDEFLNAALALEKEGDVSDPVKSDYGYHIIKRMANAVAGPIDYDSIKDQYVTYITDLTKSTYYNGLVEEWMAGDYVERFPENFRAIGKDALVDATAAPESTTAPEDAADETAAPEADAAATAAPEETAAPEATAGE